MSMFEPAVSRVAGTGTALGQIDDTGRQQFVRNGFLIVRGLAGLGHAQALRERAAAELGAREEPAEFEADLGYPGAPRSRGATGGPTIRRLLDA
jgi:phytanoyl-CoA hydroxylase